MRKKILYRYVFASLAIASHLSTNPIHAQIVSEPGFGTTVLPTGNEFRIEGGQKAGNNLFHSFETFNLGQGQTANFQTSEVTNIFGRVVGGSISDIQGILKTEAATNLFLMNPGGIVFHGEASLDIGGSFTATTANGIGFGSPERISWFSASGSNQFSQLLGNPVEFAFTMPQAGSIVNLANLSLASKGDLSFLGGTVASTGQLSTSRGDVMIAAVPGGNSVRISQPGGVLGLVAPLSRNSQPIPWEQPINALLPLTENGAQAKLGDLNLGNIRSTVNSNIKAGSITLTAKTGSISAGELNAGNVVNGDAGDGGDVNIQARANVILGNIIARSKVEPNFSGNSGKGGDVLIRSELGSVSTGRLETYSLRDSDKIGIAKNGGSINIDSALNLTTGSLFSFAQAITDFGEINGGYIGLTSRQGDITVNGRIESFSSIKSGLLGRGGDVLLNAPLGDVTVRDYILTASTGQIANSPVCRATDSCGATAFGGNVKAVTNSFRVLGTYPDLKNIYPDEGCVGQSICTSGKRGAGEIIITPPPEPFICKTSSACQQPDRETDDNSDASSEGQNLAVKANRADAERFIKHAEEQFTAEFDECLGLGQATVKSISQIQDELRNASKNSQLKSALVYFLFEPKEKAADFNPKQGNCSKEPKEDDVLRVGLVIPNGRAYAIRSWRPMNAKQQEITYAEIKRLSTVFIGKVKIPQAHYYKDDSHALYKLLIAPIEEKFKELEIAEGSIEHLAFIPDRGLRTIPYGALLSQVRSKDYETAPNPGDFLVSKYSSSILPSFSLINADYQDLREKELQVMGASEFPDQKRRFDPEALPTEIQADKILDIWKPKWREKPDSKILDTVFEKEKLTPKYRDNQVSILHLITHGQFSGSTQKDLLEDSYIYMGNGKTLTLGEIGKLRLDLPSPIELMFYSACKTAADGLTGELSFAGASVKSRVKSVMAGLWDIRSRGTFVLSAQFYHELRNAKIPITKVEALQEAQLAMLGDENRKLIITDDQLSSPLLQKRGDENYEFSHPEYWSGITLIGTPW